MTFGLTEQCDNCAGELWVCEEHTDTPWGDGDGCCGGAGAPCPECNACGPGQWPAMPPGTTEIWSLKDFTQ